MNLQTQYKLNTLQEVVYPEELRSAPIQRWIWDVLHCPAPLSPLTGSVFPAIIEQSSERAFQQLAFPMAKLEGRVIQSYYYQRPIPRPSISVPEGAGRGGCTFDKVSGFALVHHWQSQWYPQIWSDVQSLREFDLVEGSLPELFTHLERGIAIQTRHWQYYFLLLLPALSILDRYLQYCKDFLWMTDSLDAFLLLPGSENKHLELHAHLWELAQQARKSPFVLSAFLEKPGETILQALKKRRPGRLFIRQLEELLATTGHCAPSHDYLDPTWWEDPSLVLNGIRGYLGRPEYNYFEARKQRQQHRENLERRWYDQLASSPVQQEQFQQHLIEARLAYALQADQAFFIDQMCSAEVRRVILECGSRFVTEHKLNTLDDIFFLTLEEVRSLAYSSYLPHGLPDRIRERRKYWKESWQYRPVLGTPSEVFESLSPLSHLLTEVWNPLPSFREHENSDEERIVKGIRASPGQAQGRVCVVNSFRDFSTLEPGNVLVCRTVLPSWSPLFSLVSALVTDVGGLLSVGAMMARECGIPAVVATREGTKLLRNGELVYVDGETGEVHRNMAQSLF